MEAGKGPVVAVVGDSITVISAPGVVGELRGYALYIRAVDGKRIDQMIPALGAEMRRHPEAVVVNLGTNDAVQARTHPDWLTGFDTVWDLVRSAAACVVFVTVNTYADDDRQGRVAADLNRAMRRLAAEHHNVQHRRLERRGARRPEPAREPEPARRRHSPVDEAGLATGWGTTTGPRCSRAASIRPDAQSRRARFRLTAARTPRDDLAPPSGCVRDLSTCRGSTPPTRLVVHLARASVSANAWSGRVATRLRHWSTDGRSTA